MEGFEALEKDKGSGGVAIEEGGNIIPGGDALDAAEKSAAGALMILPHALLESMEGVALVGSDGGAEDTSGVASVPAVVGRGYFDAEADRHEAERRQSESPGPSP